MVVLSPQASKELLENHYAELSAKPFFPGLVKFMSSGPVCAMVSKSRVCGSPHGDQCVLFVQVWEGLGVVKTGRVMLGETDPVS